ncbi:MAG: Gfo/Idh/MocA family oxidoreductase [Anaerolineaceae bacterium]|nr:Gfo/Idh/MocA family oxidoreductase [Anaerolineaceae bacterium]
MASPLQTAVIGTGNMSRNHIRGMLQQRDTTQIRVVCEPSAEAWAEAAALFREEGLRPPPNEPDLETLLDEHGEALEAAFIVTPHNLHYQQASMCLEAGLDVLLEKPMVMNGDEALRLIETRDRSGKLLVVAFNGSMSPNIRTAVEILRNGRLGRVQSITATVWQDWDRITVDTWRQQPKVSGGGFLFDTGAHMLNTVVDLAGERFVEVGAWLDNLGGPVDLLGVVMGRLASGVLVTLHGCGRSAPGFIDSDVRVYGTEGLIRTCVWGKRLEMARGNEQELKPVPVPQSLGTWQQFLAVRDGRLENPCPPEVGLRMARLWDAITESSAQGGALVKL